MVVDYLRKGSMYRCKIRPYMDSNEEVEIQWYPASVGAKTLPHRNAFASTVWEDTRGVPEVHLGEVTGTRTYPKGWIAPEYPGTCCLGSEDQWRFGLTQADKLIPRERKDCCIPVFRVKADGGLRLNGSGKVGISLKIGGSVVLGGTARVRVGRYTGGTLVLSGVSPIHPTNRARATGGLVLSGISPAVPHFPSEHTGGLILGGTAPYRVSRAYAAHGGLVLSGTAPGSKKYRRTSGGALLLGGSATAYRGYAVLSSGTLLLGGSASVSSEQGEGNDFPCCTGGLPTTSVTCRVVDPTNSESVGLIVMPWNAIEKWWEGTATLSGTNCLSGEYTIRLRCHVEGGGSPTLQVQAVVGGVATGWEDCQQLTSCNPFAALLGSYSNLLSGCQPMSIDFYDTNV